MEASKAAEIATSPDELQDLQDDQLIHQVVYVQRKPKRKPKKTKQPKPPRVVYVTDSDEEQEIPQNIEQASQHWINFV